MRTYLRHLPHNEGNTRPWPPKISLCSLVSVCWWAGWLVRTCNMRSFSALTPIHLPAFNLAIFLATLLPHPALPTRPRCSHGILSMPPTLGTYCTVLPGSQVWVSDRTIWELLLKIIDLGSHPRPHWLGIFFFLSSPGDFHAQNLPY